MLSTMGVPERVLAAFPQLRAPRVEPIPHGLIHRSFAVRAGDVDYVLQRLGGSFAPGIHDNIRAVTEHLAARGFPTPRLLPTRDGALTLDLAEEGTWRLWTRLPGVTFQACASPGQARSAARLVAGFHSALADLDFDFRPLGIALHDSEAHHAHLEQALEAGTGHRLHAAVARLADSIREARQQLVALEEQPRRVVHGDLKFSNLLFASREEEGRERATALIDLDTVSPLPLWAELGDAWRSWCNTGGEDTAEARLDLELFRAAAEGYLGGLGFELLPGERASLVHGLERISLELAARFAADALEECYFGWDAERFARRGEHNLLRARGQLSLHRQARESRDPRARILERAAADYSM